MTFKMVEFPAPLKRGAAERSIQACPQGHRFGIAVSSRQAPRRAQLNRRLQVVVLGQRIACAGKCLSIANLNGLLLFSIAQPAQRVGTAAGRGESAHLDRPADRSHRGHFPIAADRQAGDGLQQRDRLPAYAALQVPPLQVAVAVSRQGRLRPSLSKATAVIHGPAFSLLRQRSVFQLHNSRVPVEQPTRSSGDDLLTESPTSGTSLC